MDLLFGVFSGLAVVALVAGKKAFLEKGKLDIKMAGSLAFG